MRKLKRDSEIMFETLLDIYAEDICIYHKTFYHVVRDRNLTDYERNILYRLKQFFDDLFESRTVEQTLNLFGDEQVNRTLKVRRLYLYFRAWRSRGYVNNFVTIHAIVNDILQREEDKNQRTLNREKRKFKRELQRMGIYKKGDEFGIAERDFS